MPRNDNKLEVLDSLTVTYSENIFFLPKKNDLREAPYSNIKVGEGVDAPYLAHGT